MLSRSARRLAWFVAVPIGLLVLGRWTAEFATNRLWENQVSEAAALVGTRFALLAAALEAAGLLVAVTWILTHYLVATRTVVLQFGDLPRPLGGLSERAVYLVTAAIAVVVGVAVGAGTGEWLHPVLLAASDLTVGAVDPLLQVDLGVYLAKLPLWDLLYYRAVMMFAPAAIGVLLISTMGGTLAIRDRRLWLAPRARWQVAILLVVAALLVGWSYALEPYRLAADRAAVLGPAEFLLRATVAQVVTLFAATAAVLSFFWGTRLRFTVALGGWVGLGLATLGGAILVETRAVKAPLAATELMGLRRLDTVAFGLQDRPGSSAAPADSLGPSLWDPATLISMAQGDSSQVLGVVPGLLDVAGRRVRTWFVVRSTPRGEPILIAVADDHSGPAGGPASIRWGDPALSPGLLPYLALSHHYALPGAPEFDLSPNAAGFSLWSTPRRIAAAWALQIGPVLRALPTDRLAWRLDPVVRLQAIAPFADWSSPRAVVIDREVYWVSVGFVTAERFPASRAVPWRGADRSYVRAGFVGVVRARGADTHVYLRQAGDPLSASWSRIAAPLVEPADSLPPMIGRQLGTPFALAAVQAAVLEGAGWTGRPVAKSSRNSPTSGDFPNAGTRDDPIAFPFLSEDATRIAGLYIANGESVEAFGVDNAAMVPAPKELQQRWDRFPFFQQLRDSIKAAGAEFEPGLIRFGIIGDTVAAYQPSYAFGSTGRTTLVMVNVALGPLLGAGRTVAAAWTNLRGESAPAPVGSDLTSRLEEARQWLERADAALKRGDLEDFGKAFRYLRALLAPGGNSPVPAR